MDVCTVCMEVGVGQGSENKGNYFLLLSLFETWFFSRPSFWPEKNELFISFRFAMKLVIAYDWCQSTSKAEEAERMERSPSSIKTMHARMGRYALHKREFRNLRC